MWKNKNPNHQNAANSQATGVNAVVNSLDLIRRFLIIGYCLVFMVTSGCSQGFESSAIKLNSPQTDDQNENQEDEPEVGPVPNLFHTKGSGGNPGDSVSQCDSGRRYNFHTPASYDSKQAYPLAVLFHGAGDDRANFARVVSSVGWNQLADEKQFLVMIPENQNSDRPSFLHFTSDGGYDQRSTEKEMDDVLNCIYYHAGKMFNIDTESIYWLGFSEGGTFSSLAGMKFSKELKAVVPYAGSAPHFQNVERKIPSYFVVGTNDRFLDTVQSDAKEWISSNHPVNEFYATGVNHSFSGLHGALTAQQVWQWISTVAADPVKSGFVRLKSSNE